MINYCKPDYIFYNGNIHTVDVNDTKVSAVAILGNKIMAIGNDEEVLKLKDKKTKIIDLEEKTLMPGINDAHNHAWEMGLIMDGIVVLGVRSIVELKSMISEKLSRMSKGQWLQGGSWIESQFKENKMPDRWELDEVSPYNPVVLERIFGATSVNTQALNAAKITSETKNPEGGEIQRNDKGEPTGILLGTAVLLVRNAMPGPFGSDEFGAGEGEPSQEIFEKSIALALMEYKKYGITSIMEPGVSPSICRAYQSLKDRGELSCRINLMPNWYGFTIKQNFAKMDKIINESPFYSRFGNDWIRFGGLKMAIDGGLTSGTALKSWPYLGEEELRQFKLRLDLNRLDGWVKEAHNNGWSIGIHVMGDIAIEKAVDAIYKAYKENPRDHDHHIVHAYYPSDESIKKMQEAKIRVSAQASFIYGEADGYSTLLPKDKREDFLPLKTYKDKGITVSLSTDAPCAHFNPFWNLYSAVSRRGMRGYQLGKKECISVEEAIKMMTYNGAVLTGESDIKGSIEPGKLADIIILDRNIDKCNIEEIKEVIVDTTIVDGKILFKK